MTFENQPRNPAYIVIKHANGRWVVVETKPKAGRPHFQTRADAEAYAAMRNEMRAKEAPPDEAVPGPYFRVGSEIRGLVPMPIDHAQCKGFDERDKFGYLIAESCVHEPTANLLAAAPEMLAALKMVATWANDPWDGNNASISAMRRAIDGAIAKAEGRS